jgi:hypothetical protein
MQPAANPYLNALMSTWRAGRPVQTLSHFCRIEHSSIASFAMMWFASRGCSFDARGECSVCNYGGGARLEWEDIISKVRMELETLELTEKTSFILSPSGSMLDNSEVPPEARRMLYELARKTPCRPFGFETRVETVTRGKLAEFRVCMGDRPLFVEMGLESADPLILKYCLGKSTDLHSYAGKIEMMCEYDIEPVCNILLGIPFLTHEEALNDALRTVRWAFNQGFSRAVIFPVHVKRYTLTEKLVETGRYACISLWGLIRVLGTLPADLLKRTTIAWHGNLGEEALMDVIQSPETCDVCRNRVLELLDRFSGSCDVETIGELQAITCACRDAWELALEAPVGSGLSERLKVGYLALARGSHPSILDALRVTLADMEKDFPMDDGHPYVQKVF